MKKHILAALIILVTAAIATAQTGKGQKYIGGSFYLNYDETGTSAFYTYPQGSTRYLNQNILTFNINPEIGFFLGDKWALGIQPGYSRTSGTETSYYTSATNPASNYTYTNKYHTDIVGLAINVRYYWMLNSKVGIFPQVGVSSNHVLNNFLVGSLNVGGGPNVVFFPTQKLGINMGIGNVRYNYNYQTRGSNVTVNLNSNFNFGVNYYW